MYGHTRLSEKARDGLPGGSTAVGHAPAKFMGTEEILAFGSIVFIRSASSG